MSKIRREADDNDSIPSPEKDLKRNDLGSVLDKIDHQNDEEIENDIKRVY